MTVPIDSFDAVVVGGGPAGLAAALALGRARRRVLVASCGPLRNAPAHAAHNVFTRDGTPPAELVRIGREQLARYDVVVRDACATDARAEDGRFVVLLADGGVVRARGIVLAAGVRDVLPEIPGFAELWGSGVFHCPYCHGWEVAGRPLGILARGEPALHLSRLLRGWSDDLVLFTDGDPALPAEELERIRRSGIVVRQEPVERLVGSGGLEAVVLGSGEVVPRAGLFAAPAQELRGDLHMRLGCALTPQGRIEADAMGRTSVARVFVGGDAAPGMQSVSFAAATGMLAGAGLNFALLEEDF